MVIKLTVTLKCLFTLVHTLTSIQGACPDYPNETMIGGGGSSGGSRGGSGSTDGAPQRHSAAAVATRCEWEKYIRDNQVAVVRCGSSSSRSSRSSGGSRSNVAAVAAAAAVVSVATLSQQLSRRNSDKLSRCQKYAVLVMAGKSCFLRRKKK